MKMFENCVVVDDADVVRVVVEVVAVAVVVSATSTSDYKIGDRNTYCDCYKHSKISHLYNSFH